MRFLDEMLQLSGDVFQREGCKEMIDSFATFGGQAEVSGNGFIVLRLRDDLDELRFGEAELSQ